MILEAHLVYYQKVPLKFTSILQGTSLKQNLDANTVELQWLEHLCNHENVFDTGVVRANEC